MNDRIRLAEAMFKCICGDEEGIDIDCKIHYRPSFDPFTSANDDYACLVFLREKRKKAGKPYARIGQSYFYQIGDWARSLLKEIDSEDN